MELFKKTRKEKFENLFTQQERTAIINALFRRAKDDSDNKYEHLINQNEVIKQECHSIGMELTN